MRIGIELKDKPGPSLISRQTMESGLITGESGRIKPRISDRRTDDIKIKSIKKLRITCAPHESVEIKLLDKSNTLIRKLDTSERAKPLHDQEVVKYEHPKFTGFFRGLKENSPPISFTD